MTGSRQHFSLESIGSGSSLDSQSEESSDELLDPELLKSESRRFRAPESEAVIFRQSTTELFYS